MDAPLEAFMDRLANGEPFPWDRLEADFMARFGNSKGLEILAEA